MPFKIDTVNVQDSEDLTALFSEKYKDTIVEYLGIQLVQVEDGSFYARMEVTKKSLNSQKALHGGVSLLLAETIGSFASLSLIDEGKGAVGMCVYANHLRIAKIGDCLYSETYPTHIGRSTHVWCTIIKNQDAKMISNVQLTTAIVNKIYL